MIALSLNPPVSFLITSVRMVLGFQNLGDATAAASITEPLLSFPLPEHNTTRRNDDLDGGNRRSAGEW